MTSTSSRAVTAAAIVSGALGGTVAAGLMATGAVVVKLARGVVIPSAGRRYEVRVIDYDPAKRTIAMSVTPDTTVPGSYVLQLKGGGSVRVGEILRRDAAAVQRRAEAVHAHRVGSGMRAHWSGYLYESPADLALAFEDIVVPGENGAMPAWLISGADPGGLGAGRETADADLRDRPADWVVMVHGRGATRAECLRAVPLLHALGYHCLVVSYRNDGEAPPSEDARYGLGDTEWRDVDAALALLADRGVARVVLMGWSMGGATVLQAVLRSDRRAMIQAVVLDSPVVDWRNTLDHQARLRRLPRPVALAALWLLGSRFAPALTGVSQPVDLSGLDVVSRADELDVPILILHSDDDLVVPSAPSHALAAARPDLVTLCVFDEARHTRIANYDPVRWASAIGEWLAAVPGAGLS